RTKRKETETTDRRYTSTAPHPEHVPTGHVGASGGGVPHWGLRLSCRLIHYSTEGENAQTLRHRAYELVISGPSALQCRWGPRPCLERVEVSGDGFSLSCMGEGVGSRVRRDDYCGVRRGAGADRRRYLR